MKITLLGTGSPEAYLRRASSGYLVEIGEDRILLDCGGGVYDRLVQSGRLPSDITHLFFSHLHTDHMMDYGRLVHGAWDEGAPPLTVFGPAPIAKITEGFFGPDGVLSHDLHARTELPQSQEVWVKRGGTLPRPWPAPNVTEVTAGFTHEGNGWTLTACRASHAQPLLDCMAFRIEAGGKSFVYSGDTGLNPEVEALCADADLLLHWCYRLDGGEVTESMRAMTPTPSEVGALAQRAGVKQLLLTHFRIAMDTDEGRQKALDAMRANYDGPCSVVEDLETYSL
jgi:ribonuclease Z